MNKKLESIVVIIDKESLEFFESVQYWAKLGWEVKCILPENKKSVGKDWCEVLFQKWTDNKE